MRARVRVRVRVRVGVGVRVRVRVRVGVRVRVEAGTGVVPREQHELGRARHASDGRVEAREDLTDERAGAEAGDVALVVEAPLLVSRLIDDLARVRVRFRARVRVRVRVRVTIRVRVR